MPHMVFDVTVTIIVHGDPPNIRRTLESVRSQRYTLGEVTMLCLDDGTSPNAVKVLRDFGVWTVELPPGSSIAAAKNKALRLSADEFVFFLDDHIYLEPGSLQAAMEAFGQDPNLAGVCGFYQSLRNTDWNRLRDIKRHSIYGKSTKRRQITLNAFTTFSTGIGIVRRSVFESIEFPENVFPPDFGGEDIPAILTALNHGHRFAYVPELVGWHDHNLDLAEFARKIEIEVRGRFSVFFWASGTRGLEIPYLHGFLNFPLFFYASVVLAITGSWFGSMWLFVAPALLMAVEVLHSLRCLSTPIRHPLRQRLLAAGYVLASDLLTPICALQYSVSSYKRPYARLGPKRTLALIILFLRWEFAKLRIRRRVVSAAVPAAEPPELEVYRGHEECAAKGNERG